MGVGISGSGAWAAGTVVTPQALLCPGTVVALEGVIVALLEGTARGTVDLGPSAILVPGAVDLHGDAVERLAEPRPGVRMPFPVAVDALDRRLAGAGVTTAFSAVSFAGDELGLRNPAATGALVDAITGLENALVEHQIHLRVEITDPPSVAAALERIGAGVADLVSVMDHTPGQGQFRDFAAYAAFHSRAYGKTEADLRAEVDAKHATAVLTAEHLERLAEAAAEAGCGLAWHDPDSAEAVAAAAALGASIAEFPTTLAAAEAARTLGLAVVMGAPNLLRGVSSTNNLTAGQALSAGCLDGLVSDYYPEAIWPAALGAGSLSVAVALAAGAPAMAAGLTDRGALEVGRRADLVALSERGRVLAVVRGGRRWGNCHR